MKKKQLDDFSENLFGSYTIHDIEDKYKLDVGVDFEKNNKKYMPSFTFLQIKSKKYPEYDEVWDNDNWLMKMHRVYTKKFNHKVLTEKNLKFLKKLRKYIPEEDEVIVLRMLNRGIMDGMFEEYFEKQDKERRKPLPL